MGVRRKRTESEPQRINVALTEPEDVEAYRKVKGLVGRYGMTIRDIIIRALHKAVAELEKRTLPLNTTVRLCKNKGK